MTTNLLSVIEQLQYHAHRIERSLQDVEGTAVALHRDFLRDAAIAIRKLAAGKQALEQTQGENMLYPNLSSCPWCDSTDRSMRNIRMGIVKCAHDWHIDKPQSSKPAPSTMPIGGWKVRVRGSNQELHCTGVYDNTVFVDLPAPSTAEEVDYAWKVKSEPDQPAQGEREAFETWIKTYDSSPDLSAYSDDEPDIYDDSEVQRCWSGWKGRAALTAATEYLKQPEWEAIPAGVLTAIRVAGLTLMKTQHGYQIVKLGQVESQSAVPKVGQRGWLPLTSLGQIKAGDVLTFLTANEQITVIAELVLNPGTDHEEVIYNLAENLYFISRKVIDRTSHAKNVRFLSADQSTGEQT